MLPIYILLCVGLTLDVILWDTICIVWSFLAQHNLPIDTHVSKSNGKEDKSSMLAKGTHRKSKSMLSIEIPLSSKFSSYSYSYTRLYIVYALLEFKHSECIVIGILNDNHNDDDESQRMCVWAVALHVKEGKMGFNSPVKSRWIDEKIEIIESMNAVE